MFHNRDMVIRVFLGIYHTHLLCHWSIMYVWYDVYVCICVCMHGCMYVCVYVCMCIDNIYIYTCVWVCVFVCMHVYVYVSVCVYIYVLSHNNKLFLHAKKHTPYILYTPHPPLPHKILVVFYIMYLMSCLNNTLYY